MDMDQELAKILQETEDSVRNMDDLDQVMKKYGYLPIAKLAFPYRLGGIVAENESGLYRWHLYRQEEENEALKFICQGVVASVQGAHEMLMETAGMWCRYFETIFKKELEQEM